MSTNLVFRIYVAFAATIGLIGSLIALGIFFSTSLQRVAMTDEEYILNRGGYEYQCTPEILKGATGSTQPQKSYTECMDEAKKQALVQRSYAFKETAISSAVWGLLSLLVFIPHFRFIYFSRREQDASTKK